MSIDPKTNYKKNNLVKKILLDGIQKSSNLQSNINQNTLINDEEKIKYYITKILSKISDKEPSQITYLSTTGCPNLEEAVLKSYFIFSSNINKLLMGALSRIVFTSESITELDKYLLNQTTDELNYENILCKDKIICDLNEYSTKRIRFENNAEKDVNSLSNYGEGFPFPIFLQNDVRFSDLYFNLSSDGSDYKENAAQPAREYLCGYCVVAVASSYYNNNIITPIEVAEKFKNQKFDNLEKAMNFSANNPSLETIDDRTAEKISNESNNNYTFAKDQEGLPINRFLEDKALQKELGINIRAHSNGENIQKCIDENKLVMATTGPHLFLIVPGTGEYVENDQIHKNCAIIDSFFTGNNKEYSYEVQSVEYCEDNGQIKNYWVIEANDFNQTSNIDGYYNGIVNEAINE